MGRYAVLRSEERASLGKAEENSMSLRSQSSDDLSRAQPTLSPSSARAPISSFSAIIPRTCLRGIDAGGAW